MQNRLVFAAAIFAAMASFGFTCNSFAADPAVICEAGKLKEAGRYASCRMKADSNAAATGQAPDYSRCVAKFVGKWSKIETKAGGACPSKQDETEVEASIATCMNEIASGLAPLPACAGVELGGACWFLSRMGDDCDTTCAAFGLSYDEATRTFAGSDGTNANCEAVMNALGAEGSGAPLENNACPGGFGCVTEFGDRHHCTVPATDSAATDQTLFRMCACAL